MKRKWDIDWESLLFFAVLIAYFPIILVYEAIMWLPNKVIKARSPYSKHLGWKPIGYKCPVCKTEMVYDHTGGGGPDGFRWRGIERACPTCRKDTITEGVIPYNDYPQQKIVLHRGGCADGWSRCPHCGEGLKPLEPYYYREGRHTSCGRALKIFDAHDLVFPPSGWQFRPGRDLRAKKYGPTGFALCERFLQRIRDAQLPGSS